MTLQLRYGTTSAIPMELPPETLVADCTRVAGVPVDDPAAAVCAALAQPLGYPPLAKTLVPGDHVVIALDQDVPQVSSVTAGIVHALLEAGVNPANMSVLRATPTGQDGMDKQTESLRDSLANEIDILDHDPNDANSLAYLASSKQTKPVYLNRRLCDADVVVPVSALRVDSSLGYVGIHGGLYPAFSNRETQQRFRAPSSARHDALRRRLRAEADKVAWLLGIQFTVQVVPGRRDSILHVLAGHVDEVAARGRRLCNAAWTYDVPRKADLVVATIEGGRDQQSWENFGRALFAASQVCTDNGTIVLCTELQCRPGPALSRLASHGQDGHALREVLRERSVDAVSASLLLETCQYRHVFLLSGLPEEVVEDLGLGYVHNAKQVQHLSEQTDSCILLANAHRAVPKAAERE